jgi:hypothetical protein
MVAFRISVAMSSPAFVLYCSQEPETKCHSDPSPNTGQPDEHHAHEKRRSEHGRVPSTQLPLQEHCAHTGHDTPDDKSKDDRIEATPGKQPAKRDQGKGGEKVKDDSRDEHGRARKARQPRPGLWCDFARGDLNVDMWTSCI